MFLRVLLGFPFVYLLSGFPLARLFLAEEKTISLKLILTSFAFSLFLTYPAAVLTTILEGQSAAAIYSVHLPHSLFSLGLISLITFLVLIKKNKNWGKLSFPKTIKKHLVLALAILVYSFFVFWNLGRADIVGDDYDLGYQAYNLHDGILAARKVFIVSFNTHPPLMMTIKHFGMQLFSPWGLDTLQSWMFRGVEGMMGIGIILAVYLLVRDFISPKAAVITAVILAVNNYLIFFGRYFEREIYSTFFLIISLYFFLRKNIVLSAFLLGCAFLVKVSAITLLPVFFLFLLWKKNFKALLITLLVLFLTYLPVIIYNLGAFITTGHLDAAFSLLFRRPHPFLTLAPANPYLVNPQTIFYFLADLYSWPVFTAFLAGLIFIISKIRRATLPIALLLAWLISGFIFFSFSALRGYYLLFFTIPLAVFLAIFLEKIPRFISVTAFFVFVLWSGYFSYNSNLVSYPQPPYSLTAAVFSPSHGWPELVSKVYKVYKVGDCLEKGNGVNNLAMRAYFQTDDGVKKTFLGKNYSHFYKMCDEVISPKEKIEIFYNLQGKVEYEIL